jgi:hypothetical protein
MPSYESFPPGRQIVRKRRNTGRCANEKTLRLFKDEREEKPLRYTVKAARNDALGQGHGVIL